MFRGLLVEKDEAGYRASVREIADADLPAGDVTVQIEHSTLNYKDALAITGRGLIVRKFPLVPGVDFAGTVEDSTHPNFVRGDRVVLNGFGVGEHRWGGLAERARVPGDWLVHLPASLSSAEAMALGTAGYTAMLSIMALQRCGFRPERGPVLVTGAGGGVGGIAIHLLSSFGYRVVASTSRIEQADYLYSLGAEEVIDGVTLSSPGKPLAKALWEAAIDSLGSHTLANVCAALKDDGIAVACGLAQGMDLPVSVAPFILRGVSLIGINSVNRSISERREAWERLASSVDRSILASMTRKIGLDEAIAAASDLLDRRVRGRLIVELGRSEDRAN